QSTVEWDPTRGHGSILRLRRDDTLETIVTPDEIGSGMPMSPRRAPAWFGDWEGTLFFPGQSKPGPAGALSDHYVWRVEDDRAVTFAKLPHAGKIGGGVPGALCIGGFGPREAPTGSSYICNSLMNCAIYLVDVEGNAEPWIVLDGDSDPYPVSPYRVFYAG